MRASFVSASVTQRVLLRDELQLFLGSWVKSLIREATSVYFESCEGRRQGVTARYFGGEGLHRERSHFLKRSASRTEISDLPTSVQWPWAPHPPSEPPSLLHGCCFSFASHHKLVLKTWQWSVNSKPGRWLDRTGLAIRALEPVLLRAKSG